MTASTNSSLARHLFGLATLATGLITLIWHDSTGHPQLRYLVYAAAALQIAGGLLLELPRIGRTGAVLLTVAYLVFAALCLPQIFAAPASYNSWGNFFEQFSLVTGAALAYAASSTSAVPALLPHTTPSSSAHQSSSRFPETFGRIFFGLCVASFALEQAFYLSATAGLVPRWIPLSPMFWAIVTTILFALAAIALLANRKARLAARLLTWMISGFGLLVWVPLVISDRHSQANWSELAETAAIAASAGLLSNLLK